MAIWNAHSKNMEVEVQSLSKPNQSINQPKKCKWAAKVLYKNKNLVKNIYFPWCTSIYSYMEFFSLLLRWFKTIHSKKRPHNKLNKISLATLGLSLSLFLNFTVTSPLGHSLISTTSPTSIFQSKGKAKRINNSISLCLSNPIYTPFQG